MHVTLKRDLMNLPGGHNLHGWCVKKKGIFLRMWQQNCFWRLLGKYKNLLKCTFYIFIKIIANVEQYTYTNVYLLLLTKHCNNKTIFFSQSGLMVLSMVKTAPIAFPLECGLVMLWFLSMVRWQQSGQEKRVGGTDLVMRRFTIGLIHFNPEAP